VTFRDEAGRLRAPIAIGTVCALALASPSRAATYRDKLAAEAPKRRTSYVLRAGHGRDVVNLTAGRDQAGG
jgi:hypothetical protein